MYSVLWSKIHVVIAVHIADASHVVYASHVVHASHASLHFRFRLPLVPPYRQLKVLCIITCWFGGSNWLGMPLCLVFQTHLSVGMEPHSNPLNKIQYNQGRQE